MKTSPLAPVLSCNVCQVDNKYYEDSPADMTSADAGHCIAGVSPLQCDAGLQCCKLCNQTCEFNRKLLIKVYLLLPENNLDCFITDFAMRETI